MAQFLDIFGFLSVLLRGLVLTFEALTVGGVIFLAAVASPAGVGLPRLRTLLTWCALLLAAVECCTVAATSAILVGSTDISWADAAGAQFAIAGMLVVLGALVIASTARGLFPAIGCLLILCGSVMNSHSVSRLDHRWLLVALTLAHHVAGAAWIGGMPYLVVTLREIRKPPVAAEITSRFSRMAIASVALLAAAGFGLGYTYVGSARALGGTNYGIMLLAKVVMTGVLLILGAGNLRVVRAIRAGSIPSLLPLRRFAEAEAGIGLTVLLAAASLTSTPPAVDVQKNIVTRAQVAERLRPSWPRLETPPVSALSLPPPQPAQTNAGSFVPGQAPRVSNPADLAWSEYNHHWAGLVVLAMGLVSLLARKFEWARYWPLLFLGLAVFLFIRADAENWPLGPRGFWESFQVAEVAQHRIFVLLIVLFAIFEAAVQSGRLLPQRAGLVFPCVCAVGGALLLTHSHSLVNFKEEFLAELSHLPLAVLGVAAGWARWLEIRLPQDRRREFAWIWPVCFVLVGAILLNYRES